MRCGMPPFATLCAREAQRAPSACPRHPTYKYEPIVTRIHLVGWLDFPNAFFGHSEQLSSSTGQYIDAQAVKQRVLNHLDRLKLLHRLCGSINCRASDCAAHCRNSSHWLDQQSHPVPGYCSETSLLHHVLEHVPVCAFPSDMSVGLTHRLSRCPTARPCYQPPEASAMSRTAARAHPFAHDAPPPMLL